MDKNLLKLVWGLPASFVLPSVATCRRALLHIRPRLTHPQERRAVDRSPRLAFQAGHGQF